MRQVEPATALLSSFAYLLMNLSLKPYVELDTVSGRLRGGMAVARNGNPYAEFLNIPYAQPPIGKLRFESPLRPLPWKGVLDATNYGNTCLQYEFLTHLRTGDEDCLNLNVYTNQITNDVVKKGAKYKPVIVYFYGGLFMSGFTAVYRAKYFMEEDVVLVTVSYRVNAFGFLNTGDSLVRGNMGLKDQVMALRWVQENIQVFGGDPNLVTIMGQSAGGASTHFHLLSTMSSGLFHRAISMSGTALCSWALKTNPRTQAITLAKNVGCYSSNSTKMVNCLKAVHPYRLVRAQKDYLSPLPDPNTLFAPTIETVDDAEAFLTIHPRQVMENARMPNDVPWMTGITNAEGLLPSTYLLKQPLAFKKLEKEWKQFASNLFNYKRDPSADAISTKLYEFYFGNQPVIPEAFDNITRFYSDGLFYLAFYESVMLHSKRSSAPVYPYYFTYARDYGLANYMTDMIGGIPRYIDYGVGAARTWLRNKISPNSVKSYGVCHADELGLLFNVPTMGDEITPGSVDYPFSSEFVKLIVSFARDGKPGDFFGHTWEAVRFEGHRTMRLLELGEQPGIISLPFQETLDFWKNLTTKYNYY